MERVLNSILSQHNLGIVAIAAVICTLASFTTFLLVEQVRRESGYRRAIWLCVAAFVSGTGMWATHFIAMLAYRAAGPVAYQLQGTLLSILVAIVMTGLGWWVSLTGHRRSTVLAAIFIGAGLSAMHYIGMSAMIMPGRMRYSHDLVVASVAISMVFSFAALSVRKRRLASNSLILPWPATALFTLAICGTHFTGMGAATMVSGEPASGAAMTGAGLIVAVSLMALAVLTVGLMAVMAERKIQRKATEQERKLDTFADAAIEGLILTDGISLKKANRSFLDTAGYCDIAHCPTTISDLLPALSDERLPGMSDRGPTECELITSTGDSCPVEVLVRPFEDENETLSIVAVRDIRERKEAAAQIAHLAFHDVLTGLPNRAVFSEHLSEALQHASRRRVALLCLDLDGFKGVNDLYGHPVGDELLVETSRRLRNLIGEGCLVARLGGDEFAIVQVGAHQPEHAERTAETIIAALNEPFELQHQLVRIGCSVGIAVYPADAQTASDLIKNADLALYRAKSEGGRRVRFYERAMDEAMRERRAIEAELKLALGRDEFSIHYQPLANLATGQITGFEALLRWNHGTKGAISPDVFIPLAEACNYIETLGEWVLRRACAEAATWKPPLRLSVNLSPLQFVPGNLVELVGRVIDETGMDPGRLDLEVTEGLLIKDPDKAVTTLCELKKLGIQIAMDDFGTGYSSLSYFRLFPFDKVKIDQSFVHEMLTNPQARAIIRSVIGLGKGLEMSVVAEGVETEEQLEALRADGCNQVQGYLISRPGPIAHFEKVVIQSNKPEPARRTPPASVKKAARR